MSRPSAADFESLCPAASTVWDDRIHPPSSRGPNEGMLTASVPMRRERTTPWMNIRTIRKPAIEAAIAGIVRRRIVPKSIPRVSPNTAEPIGTMRRCAKFAVPMRFPVESIGPDRHVNINANAATAATVTTPISAIFVASHRLRVTLSGTRPSGTSGLGTHGSATVHPRTHR